MAHGCESPLVTTLTRTGAVRPYRTPRSRAQRRYRYTDLRRLSVAQSAREDQQSDSPANGTCNAHANPPWRFRREERKPSAADIGRAGFLSRLETWR